MAKLRIAITFLVQVVICRTLAFLLSINITHNILGSTMHDADSAHVEMKTFPSEIAAE